MTHIQLSFDDLGISLSDLLLQMGCREEGTGKGFLLYEAESVMDDVRHFLRAQACWFVQREKPAFNMGRIIERQLRGSEAYAMFVCTAGSGYQEYQERLTAEGDMVRVFIADSLGSIIAERCADIMEDRLQRSIDKLHWRHTNRFSPGYCGWHVSEQQLLFALFEGDTCGVMLTESSLMMPIKSVSGIIGLGTEVRHLDYSCGLCDYKKCYKRKKKA